MFDAGAGKALDNDERQGAPAPSHVLQYVLLGLAVVYVAASLYFMYSLKSRLDALDQKQMALNDAQQQLAASLHSTSNEFKQALTSEVGLTKQEMARRAADLERAQRQAEAKLSSEQKQQGQQLAAVNTEVSGVKTELGGAKTDIQKTQSDLAATN